MHEIERLLITSFLPRLSLPQMQLRWQAVGKLSLYLSEVSHGEHMPAAPTQVYSVFSVYRYSHMLPMSVTTHFFYFFLLIHTH